MPLFTRLGFYKLTPVLQMEFITKLCKDINGPVMGIGAPAPVGYTTKDLEKAGYKFMMYAGEGLSAASNAVSECFKSLLETGNSTAYFSAHPGAYCDPLTMMKTVHYDEYHEFEVSHGRTIQ